MSLAAVAEQAFRHAVRWERRTMGIASHLSPKVRQRVRTLLGIGPIQEGRRYILAQNLRELFETLHRRNASYVVLRWFEKLPDGVDGDIDFLVADESLPHFEHLLHSHNDGIPCDLYSASGMRGYKFAGFPYLPPGHAQGILSRRVTIGRSLNVPCPEDHFLSLAYHAIYQKGLQSGLPTSLRDMNPSLTPRHDYGGVLAELARTLRFSVEINMESLDEFLAARGWRPPAPVMHRLARYNPWLRDRLRKGLNATGMHTGR